MTFLLCKWVTPRRFCSRTQWERLWDNPSTLSMTPSAFQIRVLLGVDHLSWVDQFQLADLLKTLSMEAESRLNQKSQLETAWAVLWGARMDSCELPGEPMCFPVPPLSSDDNDTQNFIFVNNSILSLVSTLIAYFNGLWIWYTCI